MLIKSKAIRRINQRTGLVSINYECDVNCFDQHVEMYNAIATNLRFTKIASLSVLTVGVP